MLWTASLVTVILLAMASVDGVAQTSSNVAFELRLRPVRDGAEVAAIEVVSSIDGLQAADRSSFSLRAPIVYPGVTGVADRVLDLAVRDAAGTVPFRVEDDDPVPGGFPYFRYFRAERAVEPPVSITYRSLVQPAGGPDGPPFGLRPTAGGVSGAGAAFLVLPALDGPVDASLSWDLSGMAGGSAGTTTLGEGSVRATRPLADLANSWYMAGPVNRFPPQGDGAGFTAAWLGQPPFDAATEMVVIAEIYDHLAGFFGYLHPPPEYRVFMRILDEPPFGGGTALANSFMLSRGPGDEPEAAPRGTFVHEMVHMWVGGIQGPFGVTSWFSEGLTTYYARLLPMRAGYDSVDDWGESVNTAFQRYFTSPARNLSADSIATLGFTDPTARRVPYERGFLYFADLDARIRDRSNGRRSLDDLMSEVFERRAAGARFDHDAWIAAITAELGLAEADRFERVILQGETIVPASGAFGPCFERAPVKFANAGGPVEGFTWVRRTDVPDRTCRER